MNPFSFLDKFIGQRQFVDLLPPMRDEGVENPITPMAPGTYTPIERNPAYGFGPAMNPYITPRQPVFYSPFDGEVNYLSPGVTPMPYFRNDQGYRLARPDPIGSFEPYNKRGSV